MEHSWNLLVDVVVLLASCLVLGAVAVRLRQSPLLGYLLAGTVLGTLGIVESEHQIEAIADLGVALLLFSLGLEFSLDRIRAFGLKMLLVGSAQVVVTLVAGGAVALAFGVVPAAALVIGAMVALSSTASVLRVLMDRGEIDSSHGRNSVAILLTQDIAVVPLAVLVTVLAGEGNPGVIAQNVGKLLLLVAALVVALYVVTKVANWMLGTALLARNRELGTLLAIVLGLGSAWAAGEVGTSPALGAFVAGMLLGTSPFATQVRADVSSLRVVLLTLFFGAAGMVADPLWIVGNAPLVLGVTVTIVFVKTAIVWGLVRLVGRPDAQGIASGLCLAQVGEFAFVLGALGREGKVISEDMYMAVVSAAILTLFLSPYLVAMAPRAGLWVERRLRRSFVPAARSVATVHRGPDVVIIGFGPAGQAVARELVGKDARVVIVDLNRKASDVAATLGFRSEMGDASHPEILEHAGVGRAKVVVVTLPVPSTAIDVIENVRVLAPGAHIVARARYQLYVEQYKLAGAETVVDEERSVGEFLAADVLRELDSRRGSSRSEGEKVPAEETETR